jgi:hypothetical protein
MKTAAEILEECRQEWIKDDPRMQSEVGARKAMQEALIRYAEQVIDTCARVAITSEQAYWAGLTGDMIQDEVYTQSILDVKNLLK